MNRVAVGGNLTLKGTIVNLVEHRVGLGVESDLVTAVQGIPNDARVLGYLLAKQEERRAYAQPLQHVQSIGIPFPERERTMP
jgi:hypothetical protein